MRVLHLHTLPIVSGSGIHTLLTMKGLLERGYQVCFASKPEGDLEREVVKNGIEFKPIKYFRQEINLFFDFLAFLELIRLIKNQKFTIVHTHNSKAGFLGRVAAKFCGVPIVIHTIHGFSFHEDENFLRRKLFIFLEKFAAKFSDKLIAVSTPLMDWGLNLNIGSKQAYCVIPDGIEMEKFRNISNTMELKKEFGISDNELVVGVVAKLWQGKGHDTILEAAPEVIKSVPNVKFIFVGEGPLRERLKELVSKKGLNDKIIFAGFRADVAGVTSIFDVSVLVSHFEGLGRVILEAFILGKPVVATKVGGIPEIVKDGENGFLIPPKNSASFAVALTKLLKCKELRLRMGENGRKMMVDNRFSAGKMVEDIDRVYKELITAKRIK